MKVVFDPAKNEANLRKHGLDLPFGEQVIGDPDHIEVIDDSMDYGEERFNVLGMVDGKVYAVTYAERPDAIRFISVRPADRREQERYFRMRC